MTSSKFLISLEQNLSTFTLMQSYINISIQEKFGTAISDVNTKSNEYLKLMKSIFPGVKIDNYEKFIEYQGRNAIQFFYSELEHYLFKCFKEIFLLYPQKLENKQIKIKELLEHDLNREEILEIVIEKEVENILRNSLENIFKIAQKDHGIDHKIEDNKIVILSKYRKIRNLYAHGNGVINKIFLEQTKLSEFKVGEKLEINLEMVNEFLITISEVVNSFDKALLLKFPSFILKNEIL